MTELERYEIINIQCDFSAYQCASSVHMSPYRYCAEAKKMWGISSSNAIVSIADHRHTFFALGSQGITLENHHQCLLCKVYGDNSDDT